MHIDRDINKDICINNYENMKNFYTEANSPKTRNKPIIPKPIIEVRNLKNKHKSIECNNTLPSTITNIYSTNRYETNYGKYLIL